MLASCPARIAGVLLLLACLSSGQAAARGYRSPDPFQQAGAMGRGINILWQDPIIRWSSQPARFAEHHFDVLKRAGFCTVRVNIDGFSHMGSDGTLEAAWLSRLDWVVSEASRRGFTVVLDEHNHRQCAKDADACRIRLLAFWRAISQRYSSAGPNVLFEPLNEPNGDITADRWNLLSRELLRVIREHNPTRNVIIGPSFFNTMRDLPLLRLPPEDRHIIVSVHYYEPMKFTHQGVEWTPGKPNPTGVILSQDFLRDVNRDFDVIQSWAAKNKRPIFLGEFGTFDVVPLADRARYAAGIARAAEARGWAWAYWEFDPGFGAYDMSADRWIEPLRLALVPPGKATPPCN